MRMLEQVILARRKKRLYLTLFGLVIILVLSAFIVLVNYKSTSLSRQTKETNEKVLSLENDLKNNMDEANETYMADRLKKAFTKNDLYLIACQLWDYKLYVNETLVSSDTLSIPAVDGKLTVYLKETQSTSVLPKQIINLGRVTRGDANDKLSNHISISGTNDESTKTEGMSTIYTMLKSNLNKNDTFKIKISDQLAEKLNVNFNEIKVISK